MSVLADKRDFISSFITESKKCVKEVVSDFHMLKKLNNIETVMEYKFNTYSFIKNISEVDCGDLNLSYISKLNKKWWLKCLEKDSKLCARVIVDETYLHSIYCLYLVKKP